MSKACVAGWVVGTILVGVTGLSCGSSDSDRPSGAELEIAREEGERDAQERARLDELEEEVRKLRRNRNRPNTRGQASDPPGESVDAADPPPAEGSSEPIHRFHTPSGNVSCEIATDEALCTVHSISTSFRLRGGSVGVIEPGPALSQEFGDVVSYGSTISAGSISCTVPASNAERGVVCTDSTGHGFEASRLRSRQNAY